MASRRPFQYPRFQAFDANGLPLASGTAEFFDAGTSTNRDVYSDAALTTAAPNPVTLNSRGEPESGGGSPIDLYLDNQPYKIVLKDSSGSTVWTIDDFVAEDANKTEVVPTYTDLRALPAGGFNAVYVNGRSNAGDDGEGSFRWSSADHSSATGDNAVPNDEVTASEGDGGIYVAPASDKTGASGAWVRQYKDEIHIGWYGANADAADSAPAIQKALDIGSNPSGGEAVLVVASPGVNYTIQSQLDLDGTRFDGRHCLLTKDHAGVGIDINGGPVYTYIDNFTLSCSAAQTASDYDAGATDHGIVVNGTRVEARNVVSTKHKGAAWLLDSSSGNMNKSKYLNIFGRESSIAGCKFQGTTDNMSVWEFEGKFQANEGYGVLATTDCALRQVDMILYCEDNFNGASAPGSAYAAEFGKIRNSTIWAYVEQQTGSQLELHLDTNCSQNVVKSLRFNADLIEGTDNMYQVGNRFERQDGTRVGTAMSIRNELARINQLNEYVQMEVRGNGTDIFGYLRGEGNNSGNPKIGFYDKDGSIYFLMNDEVVETSSHAFYWGTDSRLVRAIELTKTAPTTNQITLDIDFEDTTAKYGSALIEVSLCGDTDSSPSDANYLGHFPVAVRAASTTMTAFTRSDVYAAGNITVNNVSTSGKTLTIVFDVTAAEIDITGHVECKGGMAYITSAALS